MLNIKIYIEVFFTTFVDQNPVWRSPSYTVALIAATNIQRKIDEMKEEIRAMTVLKNYVHKYKLWDYSDASLIVDSKIEKKELPVNRYPFVKNVIVILFRKVTIL
jgi:hypothetical protein